MVTWSTAYGLGRFLVSVATVYQVYDLMTKLADLAVTSHRPTLRTTAGQTFLTFLLHYPLGEKRLQFHLNQVGERSLRVHVEPRG